MTQTMLTREDIIKKLQKYAKELGGKTPGEANFYESMNVGIMDRKKYWPNYGELVIEAGLTPNKFDKTKYSKNKLSKLFIGIIREKNKWPTRGELDIKHYKSSTFPDSATFYKKLGLVLTGDLAQTIIEYVENKKGYEDVIEICKPFLKENAKQGDSPLMNKGYVYLLKSKLRNAVAYKIGRTSNIENRIKQLRQPSNIEEILHHIETDDPIGVETYWHNRFEANRLYPDKLKDEWFKLSFSDIKAFKRWRKIF